MRYIPKVVPIILTVLVGYSFEDPDAQADATRLNLSKDGSGMYVETNPKQFAIFKQFVDEDGVQIIVVDEKGQKQINQVKINCKNDWKNIDYLKQNTLKAYGKLREHYWAIKAGLKESPTSYTWSDNISSKQKSYSAVRLDPDTLIVSSRHLPEMLARVIVSGQVVIFVHYEGSVIMKTMKCLLPNERILIGAIMKIEPDKKKSLFSSSGDIVLKRQLKLRAIDAIAFSLEQSYVFKRSSMRN